MRSICTAPNDPFDKHRRLSLRLPHFTPSNVGTRPSLPLPSYPATELNAGTFPMTPNSIFRRILERPLYRWGAVAYIALAATAAVVTFSQVLVESQMRSEHDVAMLTEYQKQTFVRMEKIEEEVKLLQDLLQGRDFDIATLEHLRRTISEVQELQSSPISSILDRLGALEKHTTDYAQELVDLKSALNPTNPEEILSVLRLADKFELFGLQIQEVQRQISQLRDDLNRSIENNYKQTLDHIDTIQWFMGSIALLLVPPLLGTIANLFPLRKESNTPEPTASAE